MHTVQQQYCIIVMLHILHNLFNERWVYTAVLPYMHTVQ